MSTLFQRLTNPKVEIAPIDLNASQFDEKQVNEVFIVRELRKLFETKDRQGLIRLDELFRAHLNRAHLKYRPKLEKPWSNQFLEAAAHNHLDRLAQYADRFLKAGYEASGFLEIGPSIEARGPIAKFCRDVLDYHPDREH